MFPGYIIGRYSMILSWLVFDISQVSQTLALEWFRWSIRTVRVPYM